MIIILRNILWWIQSRVLFLFCNSGKPVGQVQKIDGLVSKYFLSDLCNILLSDFPLQRTEWEKQMDPVCSRSVQWTTDAQHQTNTADGKAPVLQSSVSVELHVAFTWQCRF
jgi:hypothetical protein